MATKTKRNKRRLAGKPLRSKRPKPASRARAKLAKSKRPTRAAAKPSTGTRAPPGAGRSAAVKPRSKLQFQQRRVVIRFKDGFDEKRERMTLTEQYGQIVLRPLFVVARSEVLRLQARARKRNPQYSLPDFRNYYLLYLQPGHAPAEVALEQRKRQSVGFAYEDAPTKPATSGASQAKCGSSSRHLEGSGEGVDARFAWTIPGGKGQGQFFVDVERGWTRQHDRLPTNKIHEVAGKVEFGERAHGTAVLGIVCGKHMQPVGGCEGIAPDVESVGLVSVVPNPNAPASQSKVPADLAGTEKRENVYEAVAIAIAELRRLHKSSPKNGHGVLLLEHQTEEGLPLETYEGMYTLIKTSIDADEVTIVEPAGNQPQNSQSPNAKVGVDIDALLPQDSGAIVVGSAHSAVIRNAAGDYHDQYSTSNFGKRVNCYAWGESVVTPWWRSGNIPLPGVCNECDDEFGQTSAAAAIIAGVALIVQGIVAKRGHKPLTASQLRAILANPALGTRCAPGDKIGVMPDLSKIAPTL